MSASSTDKVEHANPPIIDTPAAPPVPRFRRRRDVSTSTLCCTVLILLCSVALVLYFDVCCFGVKARDVIWTRLSTDVRSSAALSPTTTLPNLSSRENNSRDVAADAKNIVEEFWDLAGNFLCPQPQRYTRDEVAQHRTADDLWIVIDGNVLDVSLFIHQHPGGLVLLDGAGGQDMATVFARFHHPSSVRLFANFCIGRVEEK
ncbi:hypothetical protein ABB37_08017 [Leptomonas pyrrhocoris]|uniref:Cytochrome b5 heme-binding domain-containing protein n=1 Tax=Leptomonas pyrrhocoris TaxID=157538 RepID=A0A0N0DSM3_LEPPY|nr:hypothetical protein ABB37_08017 [Leptomonas pyrrhocoris]KPA76288.1 hypothetical protein ABB37_08017 [Leptomonas pyrrhocoris]|eukprot:XP_015654727.1 hypothetical protein ABB37_08017 [Leptomonas pyrrhocoris]